MEGYSGKDLDDLENDINRVYQTARLPLDRIYSQFLHVDRFNVQQVLPFLPSKLRKTKNDIVLIGVIDRVEMVIHIDS